MKMICFVLTCSLGSVSSLTAIGNRMGSTCLSPVSAGEAPKNESSEEEEDEVELAVGGEAAALAA
jgi:hypothetical protein